MPPVFNKTKQMVFVEEVVPSLFHDTPEEFIKLLSRDGNKFLRFYWDQVAKGEKESEITATFGLNYDIRQRAKNEIHILVNLPVPKVQTEAYFMALIYRPYRVTPFLRISDITKVISLELVYDLQGEPGTELVEITRKLVREEIGRGPEPVLREFYQTVCDQILRG